MEAKIEYPTLKDILKNYKNSIPVIRDKSGNLLNYQETLKSLTNIFILTSKLPDWIGNTGNWNERERAVRAVIATVVDDGSDVQGDIANVAFAANVFADDMIMKDAAKFYVAFFDEVVMKSENYRNRLKAHTPRESYHNWPKEQENNERHGYMKMLSATSWATLSKSSVLVGLTTTIERVKELVEKQNWTTEDRAYVGRAMLLLRDANKMDKGNRNSEYSEFLKTATIHNNPINIYIVGDGVSQSRENTQRFGRMGKITGLFKGEWKIDDDFKKKISAPDKLYGGKVDPLSEQIGLGARTGSHEIMQGMSGSTIDYYTWALFMVTKLRPNNESVSAAHPITNDELAIAAKLFEVNYASWIGLTPLSMYHTQHESLSVLTELVADMHLVNDVVCPFRNFNDYDNLRTATIDANPVTIATAEDTWCLAQQREAPEEISTRMRLKMKELRTAQTEQLANTPNESAHYHPSKP